MKIPPIYKQKVLHDNVFKTFTNKSLITKMLSMLFIIALIFNSSSAYNIFISNNKQTITSNSLMLSAKTVTSSVKQTNSTPQTSKSTQDIAALSEDPVIDDEGTDEEFDTTYRKGMVSAGLNHSVFLNNDGRVYCWGDNSYGQLGIGTIENEDSPMLVPNLVDIVMVDAGSYHTIALDKSGNVYTWGRNTFGQIGNGDSQVVLSPVRVDDIPPVKEVSAGGFHTLVLTLDGEVYAWGSNNEFQIGDVNAQNITDDAGNILGKRVNKPQLIVESGVISVSAGGNHSLYLNNKGEVFAWGNNKSGELGDGSLISRGLPTIIAGLENIVKIDAGYAHNIAVSEIVPDSKEKIANYQNLFVWGSDSDGQLGLGAIVDKEKYVTRPTRIDVTSDSNEKNDYISLAQAGFINSVITVPVIKEKKRYDSVYVWGNNTYGQLGIGNLPSQNSPVAMIASSNGWTGNTFLPFQSVSFGGYHAIYLSVKGFVGTVGRANKGQLGNVSIIDTNIPIGVNTPDRIAPEWENLNSLKASITSQYLLLEWASAKDNIAVVDYEVSYFDKTQKIKSVKTTMQNKITISDFDKTLPQVITVQAIDKKGNKSQTPLEYEYIPETIGSIASSSSKSNSSESSNGITTAVTSSSSISITQTATKPANSAKQATVNKSVITNSAAKTQTETDMPDEFENFESDSVSDSDSIPDVSPTGDVPTSDNIDPMTWTPIIYGEILPLEVPWDVDYIYGSGVVLPPVDYSWIIILSITIAIILFFLLISLASFKKKHQGSNLFKGMYLEIKKLVKASRANKISKNAPLTKEEKPEDVLSVGDSIDIIHTDDDDAESSEK